MSDAEDIASRLCAGCGMCCNGALFYMVPLLPADSVKAMSALGLRVKKKRGKPYFAQPCPMHQDNSCSAYMERPTRCRLFKCRTLLRLASREIRIEEAEERIESATNLVSRLNHLLEGLGNSKVRQPIFKRCESVLAEPFDQADSLQKQNEVRTLSEQLDVLLDEDFRVET